MKYILSYKYLFSRRPFQGHDASNYLNKTLKPNFLCKVLILKILDTISIVSKDKEFSE